jgi:hypothetical protein
MRKEGAALLYGYLTNQKKEIDRLFAEAKNLEPITKEKAVCLGYSLHNLYCAIEDLLQEIARTFENQIEEPSRYHRGLLKKMTIEIPGVRPAFFSEKSFKILDELRGFRHAFRHAYAYELDPSRLQILKSKLFQEWSHVESDIMKFEQFLKEQMVK